MGTRGQRDRASCDRPASTRTECISSQQTDPLVEQAQEQFACGQSAPKESSSAATAVLNTTPAEPCPKGPGTRACPYLLCLVRQCCLCLLSSGLGLRADLVSSLTGTLTGLQQQQPAHTLHVGTQHRLQAHTHTALFAGARTCAHKHCRAATRQRAVRS